MQSDLQRSHDEVRRALGAWTKVYIDHFEQVEGKYRIWINSNFPLDHDFTLSEAEAFVSGFSLGLAHALPRPELSEA